MKQKLVRLLFKIKCNKLAYRISPSLYGQCVGERFAQCVIEGINSMTNFMSAARAAIPKEEVNGE